MILATHAIFTTYGFWLPNEQRGSWLDFVRNWELYQFGPATKVTTRRSVAHQPYDRDLKNRQQAALQYDPVTFTGEQALAVAMGFKKAIEESRYTLFACSILPAHVHLVFQRHAHRAEQIVGHLKGRATRMLTEKGLHPFAAQRDATGQLPSVWTRRAWTVFLNDESAMLRAIEYVEQNPIREGLPPQTWSFVTSYR